MQERLLSAGVTSCDSIEEAVHDADIVVAAVPTSEAGRVADACRVVIPAGALYIDPAPTAPLEKEELASRFADAGADYVDAAVLGTVETDGSRVPILASGPGARRFAEIGGQLGLTVSTLEGPAGSATRVKLLRSVFMKGRDALILEMLLAAHRHDLETAVLDSIQGAGETVPFPDLARRVLGSLALYAERRADELGASAELLAAAGVDPLVTKAARERLRRLGELDLRSHFAGRRPDSIEEVLDLLDELT